MMLHPSPFLRNALLLIYPAEPPNQPKSLRQPVAHQSIDLVIARAEAPELHLLGILNLLRIAVTPFHRHLGVGVCVYEHVEGAVALELRQEGNRSRDLPEDGLYLVLNLLLRLFWSGLRSSVSR